MTCGPDQENFMFGTIIALTFFTLAPQHAETMEHSHQLPGLGLEVGEQRFVDRSTGLVVRSTKDASGRGVDLDLLVVADRIERARALGKLSPELALRAAAAKPQALLNVVFWLREPEHADFFEALHSLVEAGVPIAQARQTVLALARETFEPSNRAFARRLSDAGIEVGLIGDYWPVRVRADPRPRAASVGRPHRRRGRSVDAPAHARHD
jgi:hypothetical protein